MTKINWKLVGGILLVLATIIVIVQYTDTFGTGKGGSRGGGSRGGGSRGGGSRGGGSRGGGSRGGGSRGGGRMGSRGGGSRIGGRVGGGTPKAPSSNPNTTPRGPRPQISSSPSMGTVKLSAAPTLGGARSVAGSTLSKPIMGGGISGMQPRAQPNLTSPSISKPGTTAPSISKPNLGEPQPSNVPDVNGGKTLDPSLLDDKPGVVSIAPIVMGDDKGIGAGKGAEAVEAEGPDVDPGAPEAEPEPVDDGDDGDDDGGDEEVDENGDIIININECGECCDGGCGNDWWWWGSGYNPWSWWGWGSIPAETVYVYNEDPNWVLYWKLTPNIDNVVGKQFLGSFNPAYNGVCFSNDPTFFDKAQALIDIVESNGSNGSNGSGANVAMFRGEKDGDNQGQCTVDLYYIPDTSNLPEAIETQPKSKKYYQDNFHSWGTLVKLN